MLRRKNSQLDELTRERRIVIVNLLIVMLGAGIGGGIRHGINVAFSHAQISLGFPLATLFINGLGSLLMGVLAEVFVLRGAGDHPLRLFMTTGLLGGFTTFSTFSLDTISLYERGQLASAVFYLLLSVACGLAGLVAGLALARTILAGDIS